MMRIICNTWLQGLAASGRILLHGVRKNIVAWRALWLYGRIGREEPLSIHVADFLKILISTTVDTKNPIEMARDWK